MYKYHLHQKSPKICNNAEHGNITYITHNGNVSKCGSCVKSKSHYIKLWSPIMTENTRLLNTLQHGFKSDSRLLSNLSNIMYIKQLVKKFEKIVQHQQ